jgi:hypothetical protein
MLRTSVKNIFAQFFPQHLLSDLKYIKCKIIIKLIAKKITSTPCYIKSQALGYKLVGVSYLDKHLEAHK